MSISANQVPQAENRLRDHFHPAGYGEIAFHPNGRDVVSCGADNRVNHYTLSEDADELHYTQTLDHQGSHKGAVTTLAFSPNLGDSQLVTGSADGIVVGFSTAPHWEFGSVLTRLKGRIHGLAFSGAQGNFLACVGETSEIKIVNAITQSLASLVEGPESGSKSVAYDPQKKYLAVAGCDGVLRIWDMMSSKNPSLVYVAPSFPKLGLDSLEERGRICWSPSGDVLALPGQRVPVLLQRDFWKPLQLAVVAQGGAAGHERPISVCAWSPGSRFLATAAPDNSVLVWDVPRIGSKEQLAATIVGMKTIRSNDACATSIGWAPEQNLLVFLTSEGEIELWRFPIPNALFTAHPFPKQAPLSALPPPKPSIKAVIEARGALQEESKADPGLEDEDEEGPGLAELSRRKRQEARHRRNASWDSEDEARMAREAEEALRNVDTSALLELPGKAQGPVAAARSILAGLVSTELSDDEDDEGQSEGEQDARDQDMDDFVIRKKGRIRSVGALAPGELASSSSAVPAPTVSLQEPFNSGSTKNKKRRFLAWNHIGSIVSRSESGFETVEIEFTDTTAHRNLRQRYPHPYQLASLGPHGAFFASQPSLLDASGDSLVMDAGAQASVRHGNLMYFPFDSWAKNSEWTVQLPDAEVALATAAGSDWAAVATSRQFLRLFSHSGRQLLIWSLSGPVLTLAGHRNLLAVVHYTSYPSPYHVPGLQLVVINTSTRQRVHEGPLPLSPPSGASLGPGGVPGLQGKPTRLRWMSFSDSGMLVTLDSCGVLRGLAAQWDWTWVPMADLRELRAQSKSNLARNYWPVFVEGGRMFAVPLVGAARAPITAPRPILSEVELAVPLLHPNRTSVRELQAEQKFMRQALLAFQNPQGPAPEELEDLDKLTLALFLEACKQEHPRLVRAMDLSTALHSRDSFLKALQIVKHKNQPLLMDRLRILMRIKFPAGAAQAVQAAPGSPGKRRSPEPEEEAPEEEEGGRDLEALARAREQRRLQAEERRREWELRRQEQARELKRQEVAPAAAKPRPPPAKKAKAAPKRPEPEEEETPGANPFASE